MRQLAPLFGVSKSAADRIVGHLGPVLALQPRKRFAKDAVLIVDGTLVPARDHAVAEGSKNYGYSTNHQVVIDADTRLVVMVGRPLAGNRNDCKAWEESGAKAAVGNTATIADGGHPGTGRVIPHRRKRGQVELPDWKEEPNKSHKQVRARVEHVLARMETWKILRDCRLSSQPSPPSPTEQITAMRTRTVAASRTTSAPVHPWCRAATTTAVKAYGHDRRGGRAGCGMRASGFGDRLNSQAGP